MLIKKGDGYLKKPEDNMRRVRSVPIVFLVCALATTLISVGIMLVFALLIAKEILPENSIGIMTAVSVFVASFISARLSSKSLGRALLTSLVQAICNLAIFYLMGMLVFMRIVPSNINLYCFLACVVGAVLGGLFTATVRPRRHKIK